MIDLPPPLWIPPKPAIIRPAPPELTKGIFGVNHLIGFGAKRQSVSGAVPTVVGVSATREYNVGTGYGAGQVMSATIPSGSTTDDIMILVCHPVNTMSTPSGWTSITSITGNSQRRFYFYYKRHTGSESTFSVAQTGHACIISIRGCPTSGSPLDATTTTSDPGTNTTSVSFPTITTVTNNCLILLAGGPWLTDNNSLSGQTNANLTNITEQLDAFATTSTTNRARLWLTTGEMATAGATGATTATGSFAGSWAVATMALKPA